MTISLHGNCYAELWKKKAIEVVEAANGEQGLEVYKRLKPHLVLLDALMPVMDGFTCCTQLQMLG
jgi:PleD family two-component response regulator